MIFPWYSHNLHIILRIIIIVRMILIVRMHILKTHYELGPQRCLHQALESLDIDFFWTVGYFSFIEPQVSYGKTTTNIGYFCRNGHSITYDLGGQGSKAPQPTGSGHCEYRPSMCFRILRPSTSGNSTVCELENGTFVDDLPVTHGDFPVRYVKFTRGYHFENPNGLQMPRWAKWLLKPPTHEHLEKSILFRTLLI